MTILCLIPPVIGFLLLAAHFHRADNHLATLACLLVIGLCYVRRPWSARTLQVLLLLGAIEWLRSAASLVLARSAMGEPMLRLALILGGVALFTALSALVFRTGRLRAHFNLDPAAGSKEHDSRRVVRPL
jgi:hypothetical protein